MKALSSISLILLAVVLLWAPTFARGPRDEGLAPQDLAASVDRILDDAARGEGLEPSPPADDLAFLRRLHLDVLGTVPSLEEIRRLEAEGPDGRRERLIARVLADPRASEQLA